MSSMRIAENFELWNAGTAPPWLTSYIVRVTNGFTEPLSALRVLSARTQMGVNMASINDLAPGAMAAVPVGSVANLAGYEIAAFDAQGHMIVHAPPTGYITPVEAASALPARPNDQTDDWVVTAADLLPLTEPYTVTMLNKTPDVWEEVTVFYASSIEGTVGYASSAVDPEGRVTFDLGPAGAMDGYVFAIWVDGLRAYLAPGQLQFPAQGLMNSRRAADLKQEFHVNSDTWTIESTAPTP